MRDPQRLDKIYDKILQIHKKYHPDLRFYQFISYFCGLLFEMNNNRDPFYVEDDKIFDLIKKIEEKELEKRGEEK